MREAFIERKFRDSSLELIALANEIIAEYEAGGFQLTLRQLYYQFVARDLIPNKQSEYKRLGSIINDARLAGLIDWSAIEDRVRNVHYPAWDDPDTALAALEDQYLRNPWHRQPYWPEVWVEKDALIGVIEPACERFRCPSLACRGNVSASETYAAGKRMAAAIDRGQMPVIFHLGDHDPSGLDMTRDNRERVQMLAGRDLEVDGMQVEVVRLALNIDQVRRYRPPPNPAKETDSRFEKYRAQFGDKSWELDALSPQVIDQLIDAAISDRIEPDAWGESMAEEAEDKAKLAAVSRNWGKVAKWMEQRKMIRR